MAELQANMTAAPRSSTGGLFAWAAGDKGGERIFSLFLLAILGVLVVYPLVMLFIGMFKPSFDPTSAVSLDVALRVFQSPQFYRAWGNSIVVAFFATILSVVLGLLVTFFIERTNIPCRGLFRALVVMPFFIAPFIAAIAWTGVAAPRVGVLNQLFARLNLDWGVNIYSLPGIIFVMAIYKVPYVYLFTAGPMNNFDGNLEAASRISGRGIWSTAIFITIPMIWPSIVGVSLLSFVISLENFGILVILGLPKQIAFVSTELYLRLAFQPRDFTYATIVAVSLILITMLGLWLATKSLRAGSFTSIGGKGFRASEIELKGARPYVIAFMVIYVFVTVILPFGVLIFASFQPYWSIGFNEPTLRQYAAILQRPALVRSITNSLIAAGTGALIAVMFAMACSYIIQRGKTVLAGCVDFLAMLPLSIPGATLAMGLLWAWIAVPLPIYGTLLIIIVAFVTKFLPLGIRNISGALTQIGTDLEAAARLSGASRMRAVMTITLPLVQHSIFWSIIVLFVSMMKELNASILLASTASRTLPLMILDANDNGGFAQVAAVATAMSIALLLVVGIAQHIFVRKNKLQELG